MQQTLQKSITINGIGLHSGATVSIVLRPAHVDHGVVFKRTDLPEGQNLIDARYDNVVDTRLCTVIANKNGAKVATIEHLMAALRGLGVDNVLIETHGAEIPLMDGSSIEFIRAIERAGLKVQNAPRRAIKIVKDVTVRHGDSFITVSPSDVSTYTASIDFGHKLIGRQKFTLVLRGRNFIHDAADCRTFGFEGDAEKLRAAGLAKGASLDNVIVLSEDGVLNPEGLRCSDEFVRHKLLDMVGDIALAGPLMIASIHGHKPGHTVNNAILHAVYADPSSYRIVDLHEDFIGGEDSAHHIAPRPMALAS